MKFIILRCVLFYSFFFLSPAFGSVHKPEAEEHAHEEEKKSLSLEKVKELDLPIAKTTNGSIQKFLSLFGKIELHPEKSMHVHPKNSGVVREVLRDIGDKVTAGSVLARIESNAGIESYNLISAIDGVILEKNITIGQAVSEDTEAFTVADTKSLIAAFVAYPRDFIHFKTGQQIFLQESRTKKVEPTPIFYISPLLQEKTRTGQLLAAIDNHDDRWISGQYVIGKILTDKKTVATMIPLALLSDPAQDKIQLLVKHEDSFLPREVTLGERDFENAEVLSGLKEGEEYLNLGEHGLKNLAPKKEGHDEHE